LSGQSKSDSCETHQMMIRAILDPINRTRNRYLTRLGMVTGERRRIQEDILELIESGVISAGS